MFFEDFIKKYQKVPVEEFPNSVIENIPQPMISCRVSTYMHAPYIKQCLEGILKQKTNFLYEIVIGEDESSDCTREICIEYAKKYPKKIRLFLHKRENNILRGGKPSAKFQSTYTMGHCRGKYQAICEGDDYWTDPSKLQKQVDFLEANKDCVICHHNVEMISENTGKKELYNNFDGDKIYNQNELLRKNTIATCSIIFRNLEIVQNLPSWIRKCTCGDVVFTALLSQHSNIGYLDKVMGVYRKHSGGVHGGNSRLQNYLDGIQSRLILGENTGLIKNPNLRWALSNLYKNASWQYEQLGDLLNAKKYAFRRFKYSQHGQIKLSMKRLFMIYGRYYRKKISSFFN